jgi:hypothetical protein
MRIVWGYKGHNPKIWQRGPNWWQITVGVPGYRVALKRWWPAR